ncbi:hypothetical protein M408DRAFT_213679 [Serendipita vermifera MAFF 305830]|uniref:Uncharacterized protein n=1 Tax=Serendipita vermifera MAFF 305830 TaxID=933852 RepID=A0A0C2XTB1_SERVB|nr:hypothetical protein M408DRAFT_213679 [Serendipita vermifera MAFF 305830]
MLLQAYGEEYLKLTIELMRIPGTNRPGCLRVYQRMCGNPVKARRTIASGYHDHRLDMLYTLNTNCTRLLYTGTFRGWLSQERGQDNSLERSH